LLSDVASPTSAIAPEEGRRIFANGHGNKMVTKQVTNPDAKNQMPDNFTALYSGAKTKLQPGKNVMHTSIFCLSTSRGARARRYLAPAVKLLLVIGLLASLGAAARAAIKITFDLKEGDKISDVTTLTAHVDSSVGIDKVEFRIDDQLRFTTQSTPYEYKWDTIADTEGKHTVTVTAYDSNNDSKRATLSLNIDNELGMGADTLAQRAQEALGAKDVETARKYARRALKADATNLNGSRVMAAIYAATGEYGRAAEALKKAKGLEDNSDAMLELAAYNTRFALEPDNAAKFLTSMQDANALRRKAADMAVDQARKQNGGDNAAAHDAIGDALFNAGRYKEAVDEYSKSAGGDTPPVTSATRLGLAYVQIRDFRKATDLLEPLHRGRREDAALRAVLGLAYLGTYRTEEARKLVAPDLADHIPASLIIAAYADTFLDKHKEAAAEAADAVNLLPNAGDVQYAYSMATLKPIESEQALLKALSLCPFQTGPYLDYAARVALVKRQDRYDTALDITDVVLKMDPDNVTGKLIQALIYSATRRLPEAKPILEFLFKENPNSPDVVLALSSYCNTMGIAALTGTYQDKARALDPLHFSIVQPVNPLECLQLVVRKSHYRPDWFLTLGTLYASR
jgi:tetratricopeptide (TPR) repeat protein